MSPVDGKYTLELNSVNDMQISNQNGQYIIMLRSRPTQPNIPSKPIERPQQDPIEAHKIREGNEKSVLADTLYAIARSDKKVF